MLAPKSKFLLTLALIFMVLGILFILESQKTGKLRLVFCDVGQGDGILIVTPKGKQIVIDGGPGTKIVDCLGAKMPFWDRTVEIMVLTHAQEDHMEGQIEIFNRFNVQRVVWTGIENQTALFDQWQRLLNAERSKVYLARAGDMILADSGNPNQGPTLKLEVLWPSAEKSSIWQTLAPTDLNESSVVTRLVYGPPAGGFCAYLTGDLSKELLQLLIAKQCQILKVSHHGSKTGTSQEILDKVNPEIAIIQVGRNRFGHPHKEVLDLLTSKGVKVLRNDTDGTIEIGTDGKNYTIN